MVTGLSVSAFVGLDAVLTNWQNVYPLVGAYLGELGRRDRWHAWLWARGKAKRTVGRAARRRMRLAQHRGCDALSYSIFIHGKPKGVLASVLEERTC